MCIQFPSGKKEKFLEGQYAEVVKCLAFGLPNTACKILWESDAKIYLKEILVSHMDHEMQSFCSTSDPSILREYTRQDDDRTHFSLQKFEEEICTKAPLTNDVLKSLCLSSRQKKSDTHASKTRINKALCVKLTVCSMILKCRCPHSCQF